MKPLVDVAYRRSGPGRLVVALAGLSAVSPFATDMYAPAFPQIAASFATSGTAVQLSLTGCLVGTALGQIVLGPVSDAVGRRLLLVTGSALFALMSTLCAVAPIVALFDAARLLQGLAGSAGLVLARAVVTDRFTGVHAARQLSTLSVIAMTAPVLAPVLGGIVLGFGSWRLVFVALAAAGILLVVVIHLWIPESLPVERRRRGGPRAVLGVMGTLLRRRALVGYLLVLGCGLAGLFAYISGAPFIFERTYGLSPSAYSLVYATNAVGTVVAAVTFRQLTGRIRLNSLLTVGVMVAVAAMVTWTTLLVCGMSTLPTAWACLFGLTFGFGLLLPASISLALAPRQRRSGRHLRPTRRRPVRARRSGRAAAGHVR